MYKIFIKALLIITLPTLTTLAMEEAMRQGDVSDLLKVLRIENPTDLFYEALPIIKKYDEREIEFLKINSGLKDYAIGLKNKINQWLFSSIISTRVIKMLFNFGANINAKDLRGTILSVASSEGNYKLVKFLLERKADPNIRGFNNRTPLIESAIGLIMGLKKEPNLIKIAKLLIQNKADVNAVDCNGNSALSFAALALSADMAEFLLKYGAEPNIEDNTYKETPLMSIANEKTTDKNKQNQINIINMLIENGAKLFAINDDGQTAYDIAIEQENTEIAEILKEAMQKRGKEIYGLRKIKNI